MTSIIMILTLTVPAEDPIKKAFQEESAKVMKSAFKEELSKKKSPCSKECVCGCSENQGCICTPGKTEYRYKTYSAPQIYSAPRAPRMRSAGGC